MLVLDDEISGAAPVNSPELYQENYSFFLLVQVCPMGLLPALTMQSEVGRKVIYIPDYWGQAGKQCINYKKKSYQHFQSAHSQNL